MREEKKKKTLQCVCGLWIGSGTGNMLSFLGGDFLPFPRASQNASRLGDFLSTAMCRNSQFTFLSLSPFFLFSLSHTHTLSPSTTFSSIHPWTSYHKNVYNPHHIINPIGRIQKYISIGPKQKTPIRSRNHDSSSAAPEKQKTRRQEQFSFSSLLKPPTYHLEK